MGNDYADARIIKSRGIPEVWRTDVSKWEPFNISSILRLVQDKDILDVGCGKSWLTFEIALIAKSVMGIDPNEEYIENSKRRVRGGKLNNIGFIKKRLEDTEFGDHDFDVVVFADSLHHMKNPARMLIGYVYSMLRPNGHVIIIESTSEGNYYEAELVFLNEGDDHLRVDDAIEEAVDSEKFTKEDVWNLESTKVFKNLNAAVNWYMIYYGGSYESRQYKELVSKLDRIFIGRKQKNNELKDVRTMKVTVLRKSYF